MKKTTILILSILLVGSISSYSQFKIGVRGGMNFSGTLLEDYNGNGSKIEYTSGKAGFHFGLASRIQIKSFLIQPEFLFTTNSNEYKYTDINSVEDVGKLTFNKLDIPILVGWKIKKVKFLAGPVITTMLNSKSDLLDMDKMESNFAKATIGYQLGIGLDFKKFAIELRYEDNLSSIGEGVVVADKYKFNFDDRLSQFIITAAYYF